MLRRELTVVGLLAGGLLALIAFAVWKVAELAGDGRYPPDALWVVIGGALVGLVGIVRDLIRR